MGKVVKLNEDFVDRVTKEAKSNRRSVPKQIEFYYTIAAAALDNPDLPVDWVRDLLISKELERAKRVKWIDVDLDELAGKKTNKKVATKSRRNSSTSATRTRKKSVSR